MSPVIELHFRGMSPSPALDAAIRGWVEQIGRVYDRIERCDVWIELPHRHHRRGGHFAVRIALGVPGGPIVVSHEPGRRDAHADVYIAVADAFLAARRQLTAFTQIRRDGARVRAA